MVDTLAGAAGVASAASAWFMQTQLLLQLFSYRYVFNGFFQDNLCRPAPEQKG